MRAAVLVLIGVGACAHAPIEIARPRAPTGVLEVAAPRPPLDEAALAEAGDVRELARVAHGTEPMADLHEEANGTGADLARAIVRDGLAYGFALLGHNGRLRIEPLCRALGVELASVAYEALGASALAPLGYQGSGEIAAPCVPFARRITRLASAIATLGAGWQAALVADRDADAVALACPSLAPSLARSPRLLGALTDLRRADQPPGACHDALATFRDAFDAHLAALAAARPDLTVADVGGELATILADLAPDAEVLAPVAACLATPNACAPSDAARLVVTLVDRHGLGELIAGWTVRPGAIERELLRFALDDPARVTAVAPHLAGALDPRDLLPQLAAQAREVGSCEDADPVSAVFSDGSCVGAAALAAIRADLATTLGHADRAKIAPAVLADARALLDAYVEYVSGSPAADPEARIAALTAACAPESARCHALLAEAPARIAAAAPGLVLEARAAMLFGPALAAFVRAGVTHPARVLAWAACQGTTCPADDETQRLVAELLRDSAIRRAVCGECSPFVVDPVLVAALVRQLAPAISPLAFTELAGPSSPGMLATDVGHLADLIRAQPTPPLQLNGFWYVPQRARTDIPRGLYPRITIGAGAIISDSRVVARPFEELGVGYRARMGRDFRLGAHVIGSGLLFQLVGNGYAPHPLFMGFGPDLDYHRFVDLTLDVGVMMDLTLAQPPQGMGMLSLQLSIWDLFR
jgi:hypothetical protein